MRVVGQGGFGNTTIIGSVTIRSALLLVGAILLGFFLWKGALFHNNWLAMAGYIVLVNLIIGHTPTGRGLFSNLYGIVFKKPVHMLVTDDMTINTIGHGISEADIQAPGVDAVPFRLTGTKQYALVYNVTSSIGYWSSDDDKIREARLVKSLFNILEGGEGLMIVHKQDNDTGMLNLRDLLKEEETFDPADYELSRMAKRRASLLTQAGTSAAGRSIQQYAILFVKPRNVNRTVAALRKATRVIRPAAKPADVLFSCMGYEGGTYWCKGGES